VKRDLEQLALLIRTAKKMTVFTGAGVSTLSGIRDFRGINGVYKEPWHGRNVEDILSLNTFKNEPELFYSWATEFVYCLERYEPSIVHRVLAKLEQLQLLKGLYTQNIDLLHTKAGNRKVYEIHGSPALHHCMKCRTEYSYAEISPMVLAGKVPYCDNCGGLVKPDIVFYGENLDEALLQQGFSEFERSDLVLVLGSSLTVQPAASLPYAAKYGGGDIVIVNQQPTSLDPSSVLTFRDLKLVFEYLDSVF
jgi:NAD-dependent deacetylase